MVYLSPIPHALAEEVVASSQHSGRVRRFERPLAVLHTGLWIGGRLIPVEITHGHFKIKIKRSEPLTRIPSRPSIFTGDPNYTYRYLIEDVFVIAGRLFAVLRDQVNSPSKSKLVEINLRVRDLLVDPGAGVLFYPYAAIGGLISGVAQLYFFGVPDSPPARAIFAASVAGTLIGGIGAGKFLFEIIQSAKEKILVEDALCFTARELDIRRVDGRIQDIIVSPTSDPRERYSLRKRVTEEECARVISEGA